MKYYRKMNTATIVSLSALFLMSGCTPKLNMSDCIQTGFAITNGTYSINASADTEETNIDLSVAGQMSGSNISVSSAEITFTDLGTDNPEYNLDIKDVYRAVDGTIYVNASSFADLFNEYLKQSGGSSLNEILYEEGINVDLNGLGWISLPGYKPDEASTEAVYGVKSNLASAFYEALNTSATEIIENDGMYQVKITDPEKLSSLISVWTDKLEADKDFYISQYTTVIHSAECSDIINTYSELFKETLISICSTTGTTYTEEEVDSVISSVNESIDFEKVELQRIAAIDGISERYDGIIEQLRELADVLSTSSSNIEFIYKIKLEGKKGSYIFRQKISVLAWIYDNSYEGYPDIVEIDTSVKVEHDYSLDDATVPESKLYKISIDEVITENSESITCPETYKSLPEFVSFVLDKATAEMDDDSKQYIADSILYGLS